MAQNLRSVARRTGLALLILAARRPHRFDGLVFVLSGFHDDSFSYQMSTGFIAALVFTFLGLYLIRPQTASLPSPDAS